MELWLCFAKKICNGWEVSWVHIWPIINWEGSTWPRCGAVVGIVCFFQHVLKLDIHIEMPHLLLLVQGCRVKQRPVYAPAPAPAPAELTGSSCSYCVTCNHQRRVAQLPKTQTMTETEDATPTREVRITVSFLVVAFPTLLYIVSWPWLFPQVDLNLLTTHLK